MQEFGINQRQGQELLRTAPATGLTRLAPWRVSYDPKPSLLRETGGS